METNILHPNEAVGTDDDFRDAIHKCVYDWNVDIISFSAGGYEYDCSIPDIDDEIIAANNAGIVFVASSGNGGNTDKLLYPACHENTISVGATYDNDFDRAPETGDYETGAFIKILNEDLFLNK